MEKNEIILEVKKNNNIHLPDGFCIMNDIDEGDIIRIFVYKINGGDD